MVRKLGLVFRTIIHLKSKQIRYQIWYRLKTKLFKLSNYKVSKAWTFSPVAIKSDLILCSYKNKFVAPLSFTFLNQSVEFKKTIDWNYLGNGKLWNYNLQYLDYLLDPDVPLDILQSILEDCSNNLVSDNLKAEPYPVSLRIVNTAIFLSRHGNQTKLVDQCLQIQINYLQKNLEYHIEANHLLENYLALCIAGLFYKESGLFNKYFHKLIDTLNEQILGDGGHYERSPMYHKILLSKLLILYEGLILSKNAQEELDILQQKISKMLGWLKAFCFLDHSIAHFNDATHGIAPNVASIYIIADSLNIPTANLKLNESGYRKLEASGIEVLISIGKIIPSYQPGHAHSDLLSFCLNFQGQKILVDTGLSTYQIGNKRNYERSTLAHNTVTLNNENQSEVWGGFRIGNRANPITHIDEQNEVSASHDGFFSKFGKMHCRSLKLNEGGILITDELTGNGKNKFEAVARFHFDHSANLIFDKSNNAIIINGLLEFSFNSLTQLKEVVYEQALGYNSYQKASCIEASFEQTLQTSIRPL